MTSPAYRRIVRRESHSPRTVAAIIAAVALIAGLVYLGIETTLDAAGAGPLLATPGQLAAWAAALPTEEPRALVVGSAIAAVLIGGSFLALGIAPGRLARHEMAADGRVAVVDNGVIASALATHLSAEAGIPRDDITVGVAHRSVDVSVRPGFGDAPDPEPLRRIVEAEVEGYRLSPPVKTRVRIAHERKREMDS